jgi:lysophospholipase L1-like esterase
MPLPAAPRLVVLLLLPLTLLIACTSDRPGTSASTAPLFVAIGASDAVGTGARNPASDGWVPQLLGMMPEGTRLANLGVGGISLHEAIDQELPVATDLQPSVVAVWLAVNDYADNVPLDAYHADLDTLLGTLTRDTRARVYVANLPDLTALPAFKDRPRDRLRSDIQQWNQAIAASAAANGATLVDLYAGWQELRTRPGFISRDGLHPTSAGHRRIAELFWQAMRVTLAPTVAGG